MHNTSQTIRKRSAGIIFMTIGGLLMLLALIFSVSLYIWGRSSLSSQNWRDLVAIIYILYGGVPVFVVGLLLFLVGLVLKIRRKAA